jgi:hypothetical protein
MKYLTLRNISIAVVLLFLLLLVTCNYGKVSQWLKDRHNAKNDALNSAISSASDSVKISVAEYRELKAAIFKANQKSDSVINYSETHQAKVKTAISNNVAKIINLTPAQREHIIDSLQMLDDAGLISDYENQQRQDSIYMDCQRENEQLKGEVTKLKTLNTSAEKVIVKDSALTSALGEKISFDKRTIRRGKIKAFFQKQGLRISLIGNAILGTTLAVAKYAPK